MNESESSMFERPSGMAITSRALRLKCPRCGKGQLFSGWLQMNPRCPNCRLTFLRGPGYYLGSIYLNYGWTTLIVTASYILGRFVWKVPAQQMIWPLLVFCCLFPLLIFRHARALWLALDCRCDPAVLQESQDGPEQHKQP